MSASTEMQQNGRSRNEDVLGRSRGAEALGRGQGPEARASDARLERMERVALLFGEITAATRECLSALAQSDRHRD